MLILPYRLSITTGKLPVVNWALIALTVIVFGFQIGDRDAAASLSDFVLRSWDLSGMVGSVFLHGGLTHLLGNMLFLWVFGNAVCSTVGNGAYPVLYLLLGVCASAMHLTFSTHPAIGASGAINGIMGMSLVLFPVSRLKCVYAFVLPFAFIKVGKFSIRAFWMITLWFVFDIFGILFGSGGVAYWAHLGGFAGGMIAGWAMLRLDRVAMFDPTLLDVIAGRADEEEADTGIALENKLAAMTEERLAPPASLDARNEVARKQGQEIHDLWTGAAFGGDETSQPAAPPVTAAPPVKAAPAPVTRPATPRRVKLRVLRIQFSGNILNCYFVNEGDEVTDLAVSAPGGLPAEMHPVKLLRKKDSGWIRLANVLGGDHGTYEIDISFADGTGGRGHYPMSLSGPPDGARR